MRGSNLSYVRKKLRLTGSSINSGHLFPLERVRDRTGRAIPVHIIAQANAEHNPSVIANYIFKVAQTFQFFLYRALCDECRIGRKKTIEVEAGCDHSADHCNRDEVVGDQGAGEDVIYYFTHLHLSYSISCLRLFFFSFLAIQKMVTLEVINLEPGDQYCFLRAFIKKEDEVVKSGNAIKHEDHNPIENLQGIRLISQTDIGLFKLMSASNRESK